MKRTTNWKKSLAAAMSAGIMFQGIQCTSADFQAVLNDFFTTVTSLLVSDFVNGLFGVTGGGF